MIAWNGCSGSRGTGAQHPWNAQSTSASRPGADGLRSSNPHRSRERHLRLFLNAVSSLGGFRTPASPCLAPPRARGRRPKPFTKSIVRPQRPPSRKRTLRWRRQLTVVAIPEWRWDHEQPVERAVVNSTNSGDAARVASQLTWGPLTARQRRGPLRPRFRLLDRSGPRRLRRCI